MKLLEQDCLRNIITSLLFSTFIASSALAVQSSSQVRRTSHPKTSVVKATVPAPREVIGFTPGDDRKLASWSQIVDYFKRLERASDRVKFQELGKTTLGRPFVLATISSPSNLAKLDRFKEIQRKLADPRLVRNEAERERLHRDINTARDQALKQLWEQSAQLATLISAKAIRRQLSPEDHRRLVDEALADLQGARRDRIA